MKVFVLLATAPYDGSTLLGVYSTLERAEAASKLKPPTYGDWHDIHGIEVDGKPAFRFTTDETNHAA